MSDRSDRFVKAWVSDNVHTVPGLYDFRRHAEDLAQRLQNDAQAAGIGLMELPETVGDAYDFMLNEYEQIHDAELGFKDGAD